jgi:hypothetical protein
MNRLTTATIQCPYCWQQIDISIDASVPNQEYVEDCQICCRPILVNVVSENGEVIAVNAQAENE